MTRTFLSRRHFLQFALTTLISAGIHSRNFQQQAQRYGQALAQSKPRKLALLVGINDYAYQPLEGCLNDVELQRKLLIHRFGFNPKNIYTVLDKEATREGILTAFEEYLIKQAKPGDIVVYHYSGHGSRIFDPKPIIRGIWDTPQLNGTFVPVDGTLPAGYPQTGGTVKDIMGHTLFLLMSALKTENVTVILDSCFSGGATREVRVRSRDGGQNILVSEAEKAYQQQWLSRLEMSPEAFLQGYRTGVAKGIVLAASAPDEFARELNINGFKAGIFSYLLTHYLWQNENNFEQIFEKIIPEIPRNFSQTPRYEVKVGSGYQKQQPYLIQTPNATAQAVVLQVKNQNAQLWLGGIDLRKVKAGTEFIGVEGRGKVKVISRQGITAEATIEETVTPGMLLRSAT